MGNSEKRRQRASMKRKAYRRIPKKTKKELWLENVLADRELSVSEKRVAAAISAVSDKRGRFKSHDLEDYLELSRGALDEDNPPPDSEDILSDEAVRFIEERFSQGKIGYLSYGLMMAIIRAGFPQEKASISRLEEETVRGALDGDRCALAMVASAWDSSFEEKVGSLNETAEGSSLAYNQAYVDALGFGLESYKEINRESGNFDPSIAKKQLQAIEDGRVGPVISSPEYAGYIILGTAEAGRLGQQLSQM